MPESNIVEEPTYNVSASFAAAKPGPMVDIAGAMRAGAAKAQREAEIAQYGGTLNDPGFTAGSLNELVRKIAVAKAANKEPPRTVPEPEPVTLPTEDTKHEQHKAIEQDYLAGKIPYSDYIAGVNKIYG